MRDVRIHLQALLDWDVVKKHGQGQNTSNQVRHGQNTRAVQWTDGVDRRRT